MIMSILKAIAGTNSAATTMVAPARHPQHGRQAKPKGRHPNTPQRLPTKRKMGTDLVSLVGFNNDAFIISLPAEPWGTKLGERVAILPAKIGGDGTNIAAGLRRALEISRKCPRGSQRRVWLFSDGEHTRNMADTIPAAQALADAYINLNVIAFGEATGSALLKSLAAKTHHGKFIPVTSLQEMSTALTKTGKQARVKRQHRQEVAILVVDCSWSMMTRDMNGFTRIEAVRDAIQHLLRYKATVWG